MSDGALDVDFGEWDIESLRLSIFHPPGGGAVSGLWEQLMGIDPENQETRPRDGFHQEQGAAEGNRLLMVTQSGRLDWHIVADKPPRGDEGRSPVLKLNAVERATPLLARALGMSLRSINLVHRLAFGVVLVWQVSDLNQGMRQLSKFLPQLDLDNRGGPDFVYQINRRLRSSCAPHVMINRLSRWQTEEFQGGTFRMTTAQPRIEMSDLVLVNKLILDVNTASDSNAISVDRMPALFDELTRLAHGVAIKGDVP